MDADGDILAGQLDVTISRLTVKRNTFISQVDTLQSVQEAIKSNDLEQVMVLIGDGYFVEMETTNAHEYINRRILSMNQTIQILNTQLLQASKTMKELEKINEIASEEPKYNEEGLPFIEIREEYDDAGNLIQVRMNDVVQSDLERINPSLPETASEKKDIPDSDKKLHFNEGETISGPDLDKEFVNISEKILVSEDQTVDEGPVDQITELLEDMELIPKEGNREDKVYAAAWNPDEFLNKLDALDIDPNDKFKLKQVFLEELSKQHDDLDNSLDENKKKDRDAVLSKIIKDNDLQAVEENSFDKGISVTSTPQSTNSQIDTNDILELEILSKEIDESQSVLDNDEWDAGDDDLYDEDMDDDELADMLLYGGARSSFIPSSGENDRANDMLWDQIVSLRTQQKTEELVNVEEGGNAMSNVKSILKAESGDKNEKRKSVRFNSHLEIKEIDNVSEELRNIQHERQNVSRFKQSKIVQRRNITDSSPEDSIIVESSQEDGFEDPLTEFIVEREDDSDSFSLDEQTPDFSSFEDSQELIDLSNRQILSDEVMDEDRAETSNVKEPKMSRFRQMRMKDQKSPLSASPLTASSSVEEEEEEEEEDDFQAEEVLSSEELNEDSESGEIKEATLDYQSAIDDIDTMAKAYVLGMYDDDILTEGPVVENVKDFDVLNKMLESMPSEKQEEIEEKRLRLIKERMNTRDNHTFDRQLDIIGGEDLSDDEGVMTLEIIEHDFSAGDFDEEYEESQIEQDIIVLELRDSYYRMRHEMIHKMKDQGFKKDDNEQELEPIDEEGNPVKVSRFKATRLASVGQPN